jgi:myo-inositol-1(or 4)-monophosphatase
MHPYVNIAVKAARKAGILIARHIDRLDSLKVYEKGFNDYVTVVDKLAEEEIISVIRKAFPEHTILGEETGVHTGNDYEWIIDPLDGTTNFIHGFPQFAVSIGVLYKGQIEHGVIYDPLSQDLYTASRGAGAQLNGKRLRMSNLKGFEEALIGSSFPSRDAVEKSKDDFIHTFKKIFTQCSDIRMIGSAALNLAYVASGRLDGFWEAHLHPWDIAAGVLMVKEAGGYVSDFQGQNNFLTSGEIVAGNRKVYTELLRILQE